MPVTSSPVPQSKVWKELTAVAKEPLTAQPQGKVGSYVQCIINFII